MTCSVLSGCLIGTRRFLACHVMPPLLALLCQISLVLYLDCSGTCTFFWKKAGRKKKRMCVCCTAAQWSSLLWGEYNPDITDLIDIERPIARGGYSKIFVMRRDGVDFAVKRVSNKYSAIFRTEVDALQKLQPHPNLILFHRYQIMTTHSYIVLEMASTDLYEYSVAAGIVRTESQTRTMFHMMLSAVLHIHNLWVAHRDIKLENWLIMENRVIKLSDFGLSYTYKTAVRELLTDVVGSKFYCLPEIRMGKPYDGFQCDAWCLCICLFALITNVFPYSHDTFIRFYNITENLVCDLRRCHEHDFDMPDSLCDFFQTCIGSESRLTVSQMAKHPWVLTDGEKSECGTTLVSPYE